ncbi:MAG: restriction endonuclease subunit S [Gammaproteobacteria bacterium]|nr:restriction endonuclease subunit S [Gammaproteobacteria bacterium]MCY4219676.1 restriction endonuclease subunit S [Gammaproteobacteria bacterium]MCY4276138.1 restriction endonuclease subunit S [Gammaproteobacteria bacterium]
MSWRNEKLAKLCNKIGSGNTPRGGASVYVDYGVALIRSQNVYNSEFSNNGLVYITHEIANRMHNVTLKANDILLNITGDSVARSCKVPVAILPARVNQHVAIIRTKPAKLSPSFLGHYLVSPKMQNIMLCLAGSGGTRKALTKGMIENFDIPIPDLPTQKRIAEILSAYDNLIENNRRRIALLEEAARLIYREWFVHFRFPGHEKTQFEKGLPAGWEQTKLGKKIEIKKGKNITKAKVNPGNVPVVAGGLEPAYFHDTPNVSGAVITISASGANAGHIGFYHHDIWASDCSYISEQATQELPFVHQLLSHNHRHIRAMQKGAAQPHVYPKDLQRLEITWPSPSVLSAFLDVVKTNYDQIGVIKRQNQTLTKARDLLLPRLMDGRIAV